MDERFKRQLEANGAYVSVSIKRFMGREDKYQEFLEKFLYDQNYCKCCQYLKEKNYTEAYKCAHTLKGVTANLGLVPIYDAASELVELLRGKGEDEIDKAQIDLGWNNVEQSYNLFYNIISINTADKGMMEENAV